MHLGLQALAAHRRSCPAQLRASELRYYTAQLGLGSRHQALGLKLPVWNHTNCGSASKTFPGSNRATLQWGKRVESEE
eukprot:6192398-Pleurochrysis_carterae.AAC.1